MEIDSNQDVERFKSAGGMVSLSRYEKPVEASIRTSLFAVSSYILIILSLTGLLLCSRSVRVQ